MPKIDLRPRKRPSQSRSQVMVELLLEAAARVLSRESLDGFNTNRVAAALEGLVVALDGRTLKEALREIVALAIRRQYGNPLLAAALDHEEQRLPLHGRLQAGEARMLAGIEQLLCRRSDVLAVAGRAAAARDCLVLTKAMVEADAATARQPPPGLAARIVRALMGYLTWNGTPTGSTSPGLRFGSGPSI